MLIWVIGFGAAAIVCIAILAGLIIRYRRRGGGGAEHEGSRAFDH